MKLNEIVQSRLDEMEAQSGRLIKEWTPILSAIDESRKEEGKDALSAWDKRNVAQVLENTTMDAAVRNKKSLFETTYGSDISFLGVNSEELCVA